MKKQGNSQAGSMPYSIHPESEVTPRFITLVLDSLATPIAILNSEGIIIEVNQEWKRFIQQTGYMDHAFGVGEDYLKTYRKISCMESGDNKSVEKGLHLVLAKKQQEFHSEFLAKAENCKRWFVMRITHFSHKDATYIVVSYENITEQKLIQEALHHTQAKYRNFFDNTQDGIFQTGIDGKLLIANPGLAKICGYASPEEMINTMQDIAEQFYVKPTRRTEFLRVMRKKGQITNFESQIKRKDGTVIWISENAQAVKDKEGKTLYFEGTVHDVTIRKKAEEQRAKLAHEQIARKEAEKNREQATKLLKIASFLSEAVTPAEVSEVLMDNAVRLLGAAAGSVCVLNTNNALTLLKSIGYPEKDMQEWQEFPLTVDVPLTQAIKTKRPVFIYSLQELLRRHKDTLARHNLSFANSTWVALPIISKKLVLGAIGLTFHRKEKFTRNEKTFLLAFTQHAAQALERAKLYEAEQHALAESEYAQHRLALLSEASKMLTSSLQFKKTFTNVAKAIVPDFADWCTIDMLDDIGEIQNIVVSHTNPRKLQWANRYRKKFPTDLNETKGIGSVIRTGKAKMYANLTDEMIKATAKTPEQHRLLQEAAFRSVIIVPIWTHQKPVGAISFITTSESERQYTDEDLLFAEEIAARASIAIDNARLYEKAEEGIKIRDEFLNIASHELKTPLTSLQLQVQLLYRMATRNDQAVTPTTIKHSLETSEVQVRRLTKLINNLLDVSRISNKKFELEKEAVDLTLLAKDVISRFGDTVKESGSEIHLKNGKAVTGEWDKFRLDQVATNLLSNALKYGNGNPITVIIDKDSTRAKLIIKDQGIGIREEDAKRIFDRFERSSAAKGYGGLGLGLYIARQIVLAHGGDIKVDSKLNEGSEFTVLLPL